MRVMAFMSHRGGVGKTTLAGHVGVQAQLRCGERVALLDATATRDLSRWSEARGRAAPECIGAKISKLEGLLKLLRLSGTDLAVIDAPAAAAGKKVKVYVPRLGAYPAEVVSCIADRVGLRFDMKGGEQWKLVQRICRAVDQGLELERA